MKCVLCSHHKRYHHHGVCTVCVRWHQKYPHVNFAPGHRFSVDPAVAEERAAQAIRRVGELLDPLVDWD